MLASKAFTPDQLAKIYNFPPDADGTGQVIGIIELSAPDGSGFRTSDLDTLLTVTDFGGGRLTGLHEGAEVSVSKSELLVAEQVEQRFFVAEF